MTAPREGDQPLGTAFEQVRGQAGIAPVGLIRLGDEPTEIAVSLATLCQQREMVAAGQCDLTTNDGTNAKVATGLSEHHGPAQVIVISDS